PPELRLPLVEGVDHRRARSGSSGPASAPHATSSVTRSADRLVDEPSQTPVLNVNVNLVFNLAVPPGRSALDRTSEPRAAQERALEDQEAGDGHEAGDEHRGEENPELGLRLDRRQPHRERLLVWVREHEERPEEVL